MQQPTVSLTHTTCVRLFRPVYPMNNNCFQLTNIPGFVPCLGVAVATDAKQLTLASGSSQHPLQHRAEPSEVDIEPDSVPHVLGQTAIEGHGFTVMILKGLLCEVGAWFFYSL